MFLCDGVPGHVDGLDGAEGHEGLSDGVLLELEADAANIHPAHEHQRLVPLQGLGLLHTQAKGEVSDAPNTPTTNP